MSVAKINVSDKVQDLALVWLLSGYSDLNPAKTAYIFDYICSFKLYFYYCYVVIGIKQMI